MQKPFLKWPGNKVKLVDKIASVLPKGRRLIEPFVGSGAVFMNTNYSDYLLADNNADLIGLFRSLRTLKGRFIDCASALFGPQGNCSDTYYQRRVEYNRTQDATFKAALLVYLNKHCYNGLMRYNKKGGFNTAFGDYANPYFPKEEMEEFAVKSSQAIFWHCDFRHTLENAQRGDVVYMDPPYVPLSATADFTGFTADGFTQTDHESIVWWANELAGKGIPVLISNHDTPYTRELYVGADEHYYHSVQRNISCKGDGRGCAPEVLALYGQEGHG